MRVFEDCSGKTEKKKTTFSDLKVGDAFIGGTKDPMMKIATCGGGKLLSDSVEINAADLFTGRCYHFGPNVFVTPLPNAAFIKDKQ